MGDTAFVHPCCVTLHRVSKAVVLPPKPSSGRFPSAPLATRSVSMASTHNQLLHVGLQNFTQKLARPARLPGGFCHVKRFADASLQRDIQRAPQDLCNHASCALQVNPRVTLRALLALATWPFRRHTPCHPLVWQKKTLPACRDIHSKVARRLDCVGVKSRQQACFLCVGSSQPCGCVGPGVLYATKAVQGVRVLAARCHFDWCLVVKKMQPKGFLNTWTA